MGIFFQKEGIPKKNKYVIPYNGEEVLLHWTTKDQYYIKTDEHFRNYSFDTGSYKVEFLISDVEAEENNNKAGKRFFLLKKDESFAIDDTNKIFKIFFVYRELNDEEIKIYGARNIQDSILEETTERILKYLGDSPLKTTLTKVKKDKPLLQTHLYKYTKRNTSNYFIHKNLKNFLQQELDFYLKNEVMDLDDLLTKSEKELKLTIAQNNVIKEISNKIIDFVAQIEDFQKALFLKKKFVLKTEYCMTLDKVPEELYPEICSNEKQIAEWSNLLNPKDTTNKSLFEYYGDTKNEYNISLDMLKSNPKLVLDTIYFDNDFKNKLQNSMKNLDEIIDLTLINSENYQGLNLLLDKYRKRIKSIYIDPPYNTGSDEFLYKDNYQHSSWLSLIQDRLLISKELLTDDGAIFISIDDNESRNLIKLIEEIFGNTPFVFYIQVRYLDKTLNEKSDYQKLVEQVLCIQNIKYKPFKETEEYTLDKFEWEIIEKNRAPTHTVIGNRKVEIFHEDEYEIVRKDPSINNLKETWASGSVLKGNASGKYFNDYLSSRVNIDGLKVLYKVYGIGEDGLGYRYFTGAKKEGATKGKFYSGVPLNKKNEILKGNVPLKFKLIPNLYNYADSFGNCRHEGGVELRSGKKPESLLQNIIKISSSENDIILDFFAGTGTTLSTAIKLGRKAIGIEISKYFFEDKLKKRLLNVLNGEQTGISKECNWKGGGILKYQYLEQYEDSLSNIEFSKDGQQTLLGLDGFFVKYMLDFETKDSPCRVNFEMFKDPFNYKLEIVKIPTNVDLIETFNYLLGAQIQRIKTYQNNSVYYKAVFATKEKSKIAIIWRKTEGLDLKLDKDFVESVILKDYNPNLVYINGDSYIDKAQLIEPEFKRLMGA